MINLNENLIENEFFDLSKQMKCCLEICSNYFQRRELDLIKYQLCLRELYQTILRLENEYQRRFNRFYSYSKNQTNHSILLAVSSMFYSIVQLAHSILELGTTIHEVFELETTNFYQSF